MAYLCKDKRTRDRIREYINQYISEERRSPSIRDIAAGTGISRAMVQRYMAAMRADGEIDYGRRDIETDFSRKFDQNSAPVAIQYSDLTDGGEKYISLPRAWLGEGDFFMLTAKDDSMSGVGISEGDAVIFARGEEFTDGDVVAAEVGGELIIRRAYTRSIGVMLSASNPKYSDRLYESEVVCGKALRAVKDLSTLGEKEKKAAAERDLQVFLL
ncbi:MAG: hypothetical protein J6V42_02625 [Clostridia bacterium]|nr:hypothetical protein [Clostridia bacterium]